MERPTLVDAGPLVAILDRRDRNHEWAKQQLVPLTLPLLTCEPAFTEAFYLLRTVHGGQDRLLEWVSRGDLILSFRIQENISPLKQLLSRYANIPMSLADACLVRMAEIHSDSMIFTLDTDFRIYRKHGRQVIPVLLPND
jgi:predicted nucleic acid-binding protein